jgi:secreted trypsin-like serine protease
MHDMSVNKFIKDPLWATLVGALVAAMGVSFFVFVHSGEAVQRAAADERPSSASVVSPMIIGGTEVPNGKYPFVAFVELYTKKTVVDCGGTLIDKNSVLTAAHCVANTTGAAVVVGRTDLRKKKGPVIGASRPFMHPRYNPKTFEYDAAVLKLRRAVKSIKPIKLATTKQTNLETPGRKLTLAGWGITDFKAKKQPLRMRQAQVPVVSDRRAERSYDAWLGPKGYVPPLMIAAGNNKVNDCVGDSGGPLFDSGSRTQVGIVSSQRYKCGTARYPGTYTEVNHQGIRNWILWAAKH